MQKLQDYVPPEYFFWAASLCALFLFINAPAGAETDATKEEVAAIAVVQPATLNPYDAVVLQAKAAYVYDLKSKKVLFALNELEVLPLASIAKIMTAVTALSFVPETTYITIDENAVQEDGDSGLKVGERWLLRDLLTFMLVKSSNDAAAAVSSSIGGILSSGTQTAPENRKWFVGEMNKLSKKIGLENTYFVNESGLDISETEAGAYSSATETAKMLAYALETFPRIFEETRWNELVLGTEEGSAHSAQNTNKETNHLPLLIASKTGYTDLAGGNLVIAFDADFNHPIIVSVLGSTSDGRFSDVEQLVWATLEYLQSAF